MKAIYEQKPNEFSFQRAGTHLGWDIYCHPHFHRHIEIIHMKSGSAFAFSDTNKYLLEEDDLFIAFPYQIHYYQTDVNQKLPSHSFDFMIMLPSFIPSFNELYDKRVPLNAVIKNASSNETLKTMLGFISDQYELNGVQDLEVIKGALYSILAQFTSIVPLVETSDTDNSVKKVVKYCTDNYYRDLTLDVLEKELYLNKYYISHIFNDKLQIRFCDYINNLRVSKASDILKTQSLSVAQVGRTVGFNTSRSFDRAFFKVYGTSPSQYRKDMGQESV